MQSGGEFAAGRQGVSAAMTMTKISKPIEAMVLREVNQHMAKSGQCTCDQCSADAAALALKGLPNKYAASGRGETLLNVELQSAQTRLDVFRAVEEACSTVAQCPRH